MIQIAITVWSTSFSYRGIEPVDAALLHYFFCYQTRKSKLNHAPNVTFLILSLIQDCFIEQLLGFVTLIRTASDCFFSSQHLAIRTVSENSGQSDPRQY